MKRIPLFLLLLVSLTSVAQEPEMLVQHLDLSSQRRLFICVFGEYTTVNIYQDTADYVALRWPLAADTALMRKAISIQDYDFFSVLNVSGLNRQGIFEVHLKRKNFDICVNYYNHVYIGTANPRDTLRLTQLHVQANDYSMVNIERYVVADDVVLLAEDNSRIVYHRYDAERYSENTNDNGVIHGGLRNGEMQVDVDNLFDYSTDGYEYYYKKKKSPQVADRIHLGVMGSLLTFGDSPLNGFGWKNTLHVGGLADVYNNYGPFQFQQARTTPTSFQAEVSYDVVYRPRFTVGVGVGYSYSCFKFKSNYVGYCEYPEFEGCGVQYGYCISNFGVLTTPYGMQNEWSSRFTTHYVNLPISINYFACDNHRKGFHASLEFIPSFAIGDGTLRRQYSQWDAASDPTGTAINEYEEVETFTSLDYRLTLGWGPWSVLFQMSSTGSFEAWRSPTKICYPFRMGLKFNL